MLPEKSKYFGVDFEEIDFTPLSEFDILGSGKIKELCLTCRLKKISLPKLNQNGVHIQKCVCYDEDTNKVITAGLDVDLVDFDKWKNGCKVNLIGRFEGMDPRLSVQLFIEKMELIKDPSSENQQINFSRDQETPGYTKWRNDVIKRDNVCQCCGLNKHLVAHHIFGYKEHPELAVNVDNGVTLCQFCHDKYHSIYGVKNINPHDLVEFIRKYSSGGC